MWSSIKKVVPNILERVSKYYHRSIWYPAIRGEFHSIGVDVNIEKGFKYLSGENINIGNHVFIGESSRFLSTDACIYIGNFVMFGPEVAIITGDHRFNVIGEYMYNVKQKLEGNDMDVIIEDDVWIGARVTILKGVRVGKGSVIGAGSIVTKDVLPYSISAGVPARQIGVRFDADDILAHEGLLRTKYAGDSTSIHTV